MLQLTNTYITEIDVKIQMIDIIVPLSVLKKYMKLVEPLVYVNRSHAYRETDILGKFIVPPFINATDLRNEHLPLIYLEFKGFRLMLPASSLDSKTYKQNLLMFQVEICLLSYNESFVKF